MSDYADILVACDAHGDLERVRIAADNRLRSLRDIKRMRGSDAEASLEGLAIGLAKLEKDAEKLLTSLMAEHPLGEWILSTPGVGLKTGARLVGAIGDPRWNHAEDRPRRGPAELWAYCGYHVIAGEAPRAQRGQKANWNPEAKMRAFLVAEACIKCTGEPDKNGRPRPRSPYRDVYDSAREHDADAVHDRECRRCGPAGHPAQPGSPLSDAHKHARAMRKAAKHILKDMWNEAGAPDRELSYA